MIAGEEVLLTVWVAANADMGKIEVISVVAE